MNNEIVIDAEGGVLGRVASYAAKEALKGKKVVIVNCNEALITGKRRMIFGDYKIMRAKRGHSLKGPKFPKVAERIMKRTVRGMLPHKKERGLEAIRNVTCYDATPTEFEGAEKVSIRKEFKVKVVKLSEVSRELR